MATLDDVITPRDGLLEVRDGWRQGRGAYGGLTIAAAIRAIEQRVADPRRLVRSVTAEIPAPTLAGEVSVEVDVLRAGNSVTTARAALVQGGEVTTHAVAVLAAPRDNVDPWSWRELMPPTVPGWREVAPFQGTWPEFLQQFEVRVVRGVPFTGGDPEAVGWVLPRSPGRLRDAAYLAAMVDVWYPSALVRAKAMRALATIAFTLEVFDTAAGDAPLLYRGRCDVARDGYFVERRELWHEDGRLLAINHQTFAVIK
jgi:acyl-CoA thioesterase